MAKSVGRDTVLEGLKTLYQDAANLALATDAGPYMQLIQALQQALLKATQQVAQMEIQKANMQQHQAIGQANVPMGGPPGMGGPQMMGGPSAASPPVGPPPAQGSPGIAMPNPDELRRVLASQGAGG